MEAPAPSQLLAWLSILSTANHRISVWFSWKGLLYNKHLGVCSEDTTGSREGGILFMNGLKGFLQLLAIVDLFMQKNEKFTGFSQIWGPAVEMSVTEDA